MWAEPGAVPAVAAAGDDRLAEHLAPLDHRSPPVDPGRRGVAPLALPPQVQQVDQVGGVPPRREPLDRHVSRRVAGDGVHHLHPHPVVVERGQPDSQLNPGPGSVKLHTMSLLSSAGASMLQSLAVPLTGQVARWPSSRTGREARRNTESRGPGVGLAPRPERRRSTGRPVALPTRRGPGTDTEHALRHSLLLVQTLRLRLPRDANRHSGRRTVHVVSGTTGLASAWRCPPVRPAGRPVSYGTSLGD